MPTSTKQRVKKLKTLRQQAPQRIDYVIAQADIELADNQPKIALEILQQALLLNPHNDALRFYAASAAIKSQEYPLALTWLTPLSFERPEDPNVAKAHRGLSGTKRRVTFIKSACRI
ncbi:MAG: tetratricopeptide repeat protein [Moraxellaceae bacterium]|nr:tetratricopeptide repeat protein [Moraxellaceae bacterium]